MTLVYRTIAWRGSELMEHRQLHLSQGDARYRFYQFRFRTTVSGRQVEMDPTKSKSRGISCEMLPAADEHGLETVDELRELALDRLSQRRS